METKRRSFIVGQFLKISNLLVLLVLLIGFVFLISKGQPEAESYIYWGLLMMAVTPFLRTILLFGIYFLERKFWLMAITGMTLILILGSQLWMPFSH